MYKYKECFRQQKLTYKDNSDMITYITEIIFALKRTEEVNDEIVFDETATDNWINIMTELKYRRGVLVCRLVTFLDCAVFIPTMNK